MAKINELVKSVKAFGEIGRGKGPIREFAWILRSIVHEDLAQAKEISGTSEKIGLLAQSLIYAQRFVEVGYIFTEVFVRDEYQSWEPTSNSPNIIDLGGDPGAIAALYWKHRAPNSKVTIVEANPATARVMQQNIERRRLSDIRIVNAAVAENSDGNAVLNLHKPGKGWHTQDFIGESSSSQQTDEYMVEVPKIKLSELIGEEQIDLLKMDIEGSEREVIKELIMSEKLKNVNQIMMEFHHDKVRLQENSAADMINKLLLNGFSVGEAHITSGKGLRKKKVISPSDIPDIDHANEKVFLTFYATRKA